MLWSAPHDYISTIHRNRSGGGRVKPILAHQKVWRVVESEKNSSTICSWGKFFKLDEQGFFSEEENSKRWVNKRKKIPVPMQKKKHKIHWTSAVQPERRVRRTGIWLKMIITQDAQRSSALPSRTEPLLVAIFTAFQSGHGFPLAGVGGREMERIFPHEKIRTSNAAKR